MSRIARAVNSSNLRPDPEPEHYADVDVLTALGLTSIRHKLGVSLMELEGCAGEGSTDKARVRETIELIRREVEKQARRDNIAVQHKAVAELICRELILRCSRCQGRGFLPLAYGPESSDDLKGAECPDCAGSGRARRDLRARARAAGHPDWTQALKRFWQAVESRLNDAEGFARYRYALRKRG